MPPSGPPGEVTPEDQGAPRRGLLDAWVDSYSAPHAGDLPWENGDAFLLAQLGRLAILCAVVFGLLYLFSPVAVTGTGSVLRVGSNTVGTLVYAALALGSLVFLALGGLFTARSRSLLARSMVLQTNVPWRELVPEVGSRLKRLGVKGKRTRIRPAGFLRGYEFPVRSDYAPLKVLGSSLGYITWGGARSMIAVPLPLFRHPKWGQDLDHLVRDILAWERPEKVTTPRAESLDEP